MGVAALSVDASALWHSGGGEPTPGINPQDVCEVVPHQPPCQAAPTINTVRKSSGGADAAQTSRLVRTARDPLAHGIIQSPKFVLFPTSKLR